MGNYDLFIIFKMTDGHGHSFIIKGTDYDSKPKAIRAAISLLMVDIREHNTKYHEELRKHGGDEEKCPLLPLCNEIRSIENYELPLGPVPSELIEEHGNN